MSEDRSTTRQNFFTRMFGDQDRDDGTSIYSAEDIGAEDGGDREGLSHSRGFTVERAAEVIKNLPPEVPRPAAVRIVRQTLEAAGIDIEELESSTRARESRLDSEIDLSENRIRELKNDTEDVIRNLEDEIRKAREARNFGVAEQERKISTAEAGIADIEMVRGFFGLPDVENDPPPEENPAAGDDDTQVISGAEDAGEDDTQVLRRPGPLSNSDDYWNNRDDRGS